MRVTESLDFRSYQDGMTEIIFWDNKNGDDVVAAVDKDGNMTIAGKPSTMKDFILKVRQVSSAENKSASF